MWLWLRGLLIEHCLFSNLLRFRHPYQIHDSYHFGGIKSSVPPYQNCSYLWWDNLPPVKTIVIRRREHWKVWIDIFWIDEKVHSFHDIFLPWGLISIWIHNLKDETCPNPNCSKRISGESHFRPMLPVNVTHFVWRNGYFPVALTVEERGLGRRNTHPMSGLSLMSRSSIKRFSDLNSGPTQTPSDSLVLRSSNGSVSRNDCRPESLAVGNVGKSTCGDCFWYPILRSTGFVCCWGKFLILEVLATKSERNAVMGFAISVTQPAIPDQIGSTSIEVVAACSDDVGNDRKYAKTKNWYKPDFPAKIDLHTLKKKNRNEHR